MGTALEKLILAQRETQSLLSVGLEPCPEYLPCGFEPTLAGYRGAMQLMVDATRGLAAAYKLNLAFFESLGPDGADLLYDVRAMIPDSTLSIADGKRSDIGSSARRYAQALFDELAVDAATVNPLMGRDSVEAFLAHEQNLSFVLALTSNPGAEDFLTSGDLWKRIIERSLDWATAKNCGFVVGATRSGMIGDVRALAGNAPLLVPGVGAQGGSMTDSVRAAVVSPDQPRALIHATRGLLGVESDQGDPADIIHNNALNMVIRMREAINHECAND